MAELKPCPFCGVPPKMNGLWLSETKKITHWMPLPQPPNEVSQ